MNWTVVAGVLGAVGTLGWIGNVIKAVLVRGKDRADAASVVADSAVELLQPFRSEIKELHLEVTGLRAAVRKLTHDVEERDRTIRDHEATIFDLQRHNGQRRG